MKLSHRILSVETSQTVQFSALIQKLTGAGKHIIDFAVGEPGFDIAELAIKNDLCIIADEAYRFFVYDGMEHFSLFSIETLRDRCITVGSFSKTHAMTGFRIGFAAAPKPLFQALSTLQSHMTGNACTFSQYGALAALDTHPDMIERMINVL